MARRPAEHRPESQAAAEPGNRTGAEWGRCTGKANDVSLSVPDRRTTPSRQSSGAGGAEGARAQRELQTLRLTLQRVQFAAIVGTGAGWDTMLVEGGLDRLKILSAAVEAKVERLRRKHIQERVSSWKSWVQQAVEKGGRQAHRFMKDAVTSAQLDTDEGPRLGMVAIQHLGASGSPCGRSS